MAKQVLYSPVDISDAEYSDFEPDAKMEEENAEFEQFKTEMHDAQFDAKITVGKKLTDSAGRPMGRQVFECFECAVDDYTFSQLCTRIREDFGTGLYQIHGRDSKGKYKFKKTVGILAPKNSVDNEPAGQDVGNLIDKFSDAMQRQQMATEQMFLKIAGPRTGGDAIDQIVKIAGAIAPVLAALGISRPDAAPPPKTLIEQLTEMKMVQDMMGGGNDQQYGEANGWSALTETLKALGPAIGGALAGGGPVASVPDVPVAQLEAPLVGAPETSNEAEKMTPEKIETEKAALTQQINMLLIQAKGGANPLAVANAIVDMTPTENEERLWDTISDEKCVDKMIAAVPEVSEHREWFESLRDFIIEIMAEPEPNDLRGDAMAAKAEDQEPASDESLQNLENVDNVSDSGVVAGADHLIGEETFTTDGNDSDTTGNT